MKIETLNKEAREICQKAYKKQKDHFHNDDFVDDYLQFCKVTHFKDTSAENFMVYRKIYGGTSAQKDRQFQSSDNSGGRMYAHNRMMKATDSEKLTHAFIEDHRVEMMRRMTHANRG
jgi:hypothetical protein